MSLARDPLSTRAARRLPAAVTVLLLVMAPRVVHACSVCFGNPDSPHTKGMSNAILFLLAVIGAVLVSFAAFFLRLWRMARTARAGDVGVLMRHTSLRNLSSGSNGSHRSGGRRSFD